MPQRYKLRLGDGTVLVVDENGLNTWSVDAKAMVQAAGGRWRPLKDVLAMRHAAAKYAAQQQQEASPRAALPLVPPPPKRRHGKSASAPAPPSSADLAEPPSLGELAGVQALAEEPTGPGDDYPRPEPGADAGFPIFPSEPPVENEAAPLPDTFSQSEPLALSTTEPPAPQAWADEPPKGWADEPPKAWADEPPIQSTESLPYQAPPDEEVVAIPPKPLDDEPARPEVAWWRDEMEPPSVTARPNLQVLADDPAPQHGYAGQTSASDDGFPTVPLKPLDERNETYAPAVTGTGIYDDEHDDFVPQRPRGFVLDERFVQAIDALGAFLSWCVEGLERLYAGLRSASAGALARRRAAGPPPSVPEEPRPSVPVPPRLQAPAEETARPIDEEPWRGPLAAEEPPVIRLKPLDDERAPLRAAQTLLRRLGSGAAAWAAGVKGWVGGLARPTRPSASGASSEPTWSAAYPAPEPLKAPPPLSELPVLPLAAIDEPKELEDIYEGTGESLLPVAWLWTKRIVWISALVAGGSYAALTWEAWFPRAAHVGETALTEVGTYIQTQEQTARQEHALHLATEQLPHLTPETVRLVLSISPSGVLTPPEAFQDACDAADRGLSALSPEEAQELEALRSTLLDTLSPAEGARVREYDQARARRATFAFENRTALDLFARGAHALPPETLERLQALLGKAVAAGLPRPTVAAPGAPAER